MKNIETNGKKVQIVGIGGSPSPQSSDLAALRIATLEMSRLGASVSIVDIGDTDFPFYRPEADPPEEVLQFIELISGADAIVLASPAYLGCVSGALKNALDWLLLLSDKTPPLLSGKLVGCIVSTHDGQGEQVLDGIATICRSLRAISAPSFVIISDPRNMLSGQGISQNKQVIEQLRSLARDIVRWASLTKALRHQSVSRAAAG